MSSTYTQQLWTERSLSTGITPGPTVPDGQLWVVRDAVFYMNYVRPGFAAGHIIVREVIDQVPICGVGELDAYNGGFFRSELRQALNAGDQIEVECTAGGWNLRLTGYIFNT